MQILGPSIAALPAGTPLTTEIVAVVTGSMGWSLPDTGLFNSKIDLELIPSNGTGTTNTTVVYACGNDIPSIDPGLDCVNYGDSGSVSVILSDDLAVHSTVGQIFDLTADFSIAAHADTPGNIPASLDDSFFDPFSIVSVQVTDDLTGQVLPDAVLVGSNGPIPLGTPEPSSLSVASTALVGMALLARKRLWKRDGR
ncbi:MAG TPA: hypothetical protein VKB88_44250 [Bryobacteraceae bacterium]|nr:hypothetical protein [Bryobacteraceae bacterium]